MKMLMLMLATVTVFAVGCVTERAGMPTPPTDEQMRVTVRRAVQRLITDPDFKTMYGRVKSHVSARGNDRPTMTIDELESHVKGLSDYVLNPARDELKVAVRKTRLFRIADSRWSETSDFGLSGNLTVSSDGLHYYLSMRLLYYANDNEEIWNDFQEVGRE